MAVSKVSKKTQKRRCANKAAKKMKKVIFHLASHDAEKLGVYARQHNIPFSLAAKRLLRLQLQQIEISLSHKEDENQLNIFDSIQIDIFNQVKKTTTEK